MLYPEDDHPLASASTDADVWGNVLLWLREHVLGEADPRATAPSRTMQEFLQQRDAAGSAAATE